MISTLMGDRKNYVGKLLFLNYGGCSASHKTNANYGNLMSEKLNFIIGINFVLCIIYSVAQTR